MPSIQLPELDSHRYQQLFEEALRRVPVHSPEWTDFSQSDPGVTFLELFAWLADNLGHRLGRIPERKRVILRKIAARRPLRCRHPRVLIIGRRKKAMSALAQFIASELGLEVFRIDVAAVVNKYLGETEKNLARVFDRAEESGCILFFDEADALFGKR